MTEIVIEAHRRKIPIDHPDGSIEASKFYIKQGVTYHVPFEGSFWGKSISGKAKFNKALYLWGASEDEAWSEVYAILYEGEYVRIDNVVLDYVSKIGSPSVSIDSVGGYKAIKLYRSETCQREGIGLSDYNLSDIEIYWLVLGVKGEIIERWQDISVYDNAYFFDFDTGVTTADFKIAKMENGTRTTLATESVDLSSSTIYKLKAELVGSTLKFYRDDLSTPKLTATDTTFASGKMGLGRHDVDLRWAKIYRVPYGSGKYHLKPLYIIETDMTEEYEGKYAFKAPNILHDVKDGKDLLSVTICGFEIEPNSNNIFFVYGNNQYNPKAIGTQVEYLKKKNFKVLKPPKDYKESTEQYRKLKADFPHWIAGKDNWAYQTLGHEIFELFQVADTYHGNIVEGYKPNAYKKVPDLVMRKTLSMWKERLKKVSTLVEERDKHLKKLEKVEKIGW